MPKEIMKQMKDNIESVVGSSSKPVDNTYNTYCMQSDKMTVRGNDIIT